MDVKQPTESGGKVEKINYQKETDKVLESLCGRPGLLLHSCCGPCSSYVLEYLSRFFDIKVFYYNPNIRPEEEYERRLENQKKLLREMHPEGVCPEPVTLPYDPAPFEEIERGLEDLPEGGERCLKCYRLRLEKTAEYAAAHGYEWFCTTLSVSPHKDAAALNRIGFETAGKYGLKYLVSDFKKRSGYLRSIRLSEQYGLYRQNYCGCTPPGGGDLPQ
ncbi:MAG: epoxyqueuosine reductase QueH [Clostridia bacterium]|nr:epoxyqueuosine reductase QueH [Clostridia bacterium]